jgi:hypothetical protein
MFDGMRPVRTFFFITRRVPGFPNPPRFPMGFKNNAGSMANRILNAAFL